MVNTLPAESRYSKWFIWQPEISSPHIPSVNQYPIIAIHPWRNYKVEIVAKVVIFLTRKTTGNRIYSLQHRIKQVIELKVMDQCLLMIFRFF